jgi:hypothetical protein
MPELMSEQDRRELARAADYIHRMNDEADRANHEREQLEQADDATLRALLYDRANSTITRSNALMLLLMRNRKRRDGALSEIMLPLWHDPDEELAEMAIGYTPPSDPGMTERLRELMDDSQSHRWSKAAEVLTQRKDTAIVPRLLAWFREGDKEHRNVAYACLIFYGLLGPDESRAILREAWDAGGRDDEDRAMLAGALLDLGDRSGWSFLVDLVRRADHNSACWAAETIKKHDPALGLDLMLHILDHGTTFKVRWGMVETIAHAADLSHLWTADGLAEARYWVEQQRLGLDPTRPRPVV